MRDGARRALAALHALERGGDPGVEPRRRRTAARLPPGDPDRPAAAPEPPRRAGRPRPESGTDGRGPARDLRAAREGRRVAGQDGAEAIAARRAIDEEQRRRLEALLSPEQQDRLVQIDLQWEGPSALISRKMVAESLNLDDRQRATLAQAVSDRDRRRAQAPDRGGDERQLAEQALAVLTGAAEGPLEGDARASPGHPATGRARRPPTRARPR